MRKLLVLLLALALCYFISAPTYAYVPPETYEYYPNYPSMWLRGIADEGIAYDSGNFYVTTWQHNVYKFNNNPPITGWGGPYGYRPEEFAFPKGIAIDSNKGFAYVVDSGNNRIKKFDLNGNLKKMWPDNTKSGTIWGQAGAENGWFSNPTGIAVDLYGNVYVTDTGNNRIQKFDPDGTFKGMWGSINISIKPSTPWGQAGTENVLFNKPTGIAYDRTKNNLYVANKGNHLIYRLDLNGKKLMQFGGYGTTTGKFNQPYGITVDGNSNVYVADYNNNRIQKFDGNGNFITSWGSYGYGGTIWIDNPGKFNHPAGVAVAPDGSFVYVADSDNRRVQAFRRYQTIY